VALQFLGTTAIVRGATRNVAGGQIEQVDSIVDLYFRNFL